MSEELTLKEYIDNLSSSAPVPGGGHAAATVLGFACGLMLMSLRIAVLKKKPENRAALELEMKLSELQKRSLNLAEKDSESFMEVMKNWKNPGEALDRALLASAEVSLDISSAALELLSLIEMEDLRRYSNIITDVGLAVSLAGSAHRGGVMNFRVNIRTLTTEYAKTLESKNRETELRFRRIYSLLRGEAERLAGVV